MNRTVTRYLQRRTAFGDWPLQGATPTICKAVVVIPVLAEFPGILDTLRDLARCEAERRAQTLVVIVLNNRAPAHARIEDITDNQQTLVALSEWDQNILPVAWIDVSSPGCELSPKDGVGMARKIGLDWGLRTLTEQDRLSAPLVCLDGDSRVDAQYLTVLHDFFDPPAARWACVLPYAHPIEGDDQHQAAILCYELYLRYHALHLCWAGSPYGYHTIGSTMACTALAYASVSGMNRRLAGEDFYFLQQLAKTGKVEQVTGTIVQPSARPSHRAPFGTGRWVQRFLAGEVGEYRLYHPDSYDVIRQWLQLALSEPERDGEQLLTTAQTIHHELGTFLQQQDFVQSWDRIHAQASSRQALLEQFHRWFDGFRTVKLIHHLRDTTYGETEMFVALGVLLQRLAIDFDGLSGSSTEPGLEQQRRLLQHLRGL